MTLDVPLATLLIFSAACYALLGIRVATTSSAGSMPSGALFVLLGCWVMGAAIELLSESFVTFSAGRTAHFIGSGLAPVAAYVCFRAYTGAPLPVRTVWMLLPIPLLSILLAATNMHHELVWFMPFTNEAGEYLTRPTRWGPWFLFVHMPYCYAVMGAALLTLISHTMAVAAGHRRGLYLLMAACVPPVLSVTLYDLGIGPTTFSYVSLVLVAMLPLYAWLVVSEQLAEFTPLAYETVFQNMQDPVVVIDNRCRVIGLNQTAESMLSINETAALLKPLESVFGDDSPEVFEVLESGQPQRMMTSTGRFLHVQVSPIANNRATVQGGQVLMFRDVSDVEKAQSEVRKSEKLLRTLIDHSVNGILRLRWAQDASGPRVLRCIFANAAAGKFLGVDAGELVGQSARKIVNYATSDMEVGQTGEIQRRLEQAVELGGGLDVEVRCRGAGTSRWLRLICEPVGDDFAATFVDITDGKAKERHMESIATSDPLTGVLNRRGFERDATRRLSESEDHATGALLFIDLNGFKLINDRHGHEIGDQILIIAADRLRRSLRSCDIIGRPGGDEFVALVPDVDGDVADRLATRLAMSLERPYAIGKDKLDCAASIGLALYPKNANTLTGLLREADRAMYRAKARSRNFDEISSEDLLERAI